MKKKSVFLLISNILLDFFLIALASYLAVSLFALKERTEISDNFAEVLISGHYTVLFMFLGALVLFISLVAGWVSFVKNEKNIKGIAAIILSIGNAVLVLATVAAYLGNPAYSLASLLFAAFFVPSTALSWTAFLLKK